MKTRLIAPVGAGKRFTVCKSLLLAATISFSFTSTAWSQTYLEPVGGYGGSAFERRCASGEYLHGFELRAGSDVDAIRPVCFEPAGQGEHIAPGKYAGAWHGGPGGSIVQLHCPANQGISAVRGMRVLVEGKRIQTVNEIRLYCGPVSTAPFQLGEPDASFKAPEQQDSQTFIGTTYSMVVHGAQTQRCPDGEVAVGVHGRTGAWVDAIGLICAAPEPDRGLAGLDRRPPPVALGRVQPTSPPPVALGRVQPTSPPPVALGRVQSAPGSNPSPPICDAARSARARNSPAAPGLERQCAAQTLPVALGRVQPTTQGPGPLDKKQIPMSVILNPPPICASATSARARNSPAAPGLERQCQFAMERAADAARTAPPPVAPPSIPSAPPIGNPPVSGGPWQPSSVCDAAREARYNGSPDAYALEDQCRAQGGYLPAPVSSAPGSPGSWQPSPICDAAREARYNNNPAAERLEALCRAGSDVWGKPGTRIPLSVAERSELLDVHNRLRPDFLRLQWDVALEDGAARWAAQLATSGQLANDDMLRGAQGENLYMAPSGRYTFGDIGRIWASERSAFRPGIFPDVSGSGSAAQVAHYTQMIWPDTTYVGCAVQRTPRADFFVCRYSPVGNIYGRPIR